MKSMKLKGKLTKLGDYWHLNYKAENAGEDNWYNNVQIITKRESKTIDSFPEINGDVGLLLSKRFNIPIDQLEGLDVELQCVIHFNKLIIII